MATMRVLMFGDLVGVPGRAIFQKYCQKLKTHYQADVIIVNGENSASDGRGITPKIMRFFKHLGVTAVTSGNHIFQKKDIIQYFSEHKDLLRPLNFPSSCPGTGVGVYEVAGLKLGIINVQGRVFMRELLGCPFKAVETALTYLQTQTNMIIVDMHAETTSEKMGMGYFLDGKVSAVVGTHTHVQTADERILPQGTAFISDLGMSGALNSMIGMKKEVVIRNILTQMPVKFEVELEGPYFTSGVVIDIDTQTGKAIHIERFKIVDSDISLQGDDFSDK